MRRRPSVSPLGIDLPRLADLIDGLGAPRERLILRLKFQEDQLGCRLRGRQLRIGERAAGNMARLGGGSLLAATVALAIGDQPSAVVLGVAAATLLFLVVGTILSVVIERRAVTWDFEADRLAAALSEMTEYHGHG